MLDATELEFRKRFWERVRACLIRFHDRSPAEAKELVSAYTKKFPLKSKDPEVELVYHYEPFRIACDITGKRLRVSDFSKRYQELLQETSPISKTLKVRGSGVSF